LLLFLEGFMSFLDVFALLIPASFALLMVAEARFPARQLGPAPGFRWLGWACFVVMAAIGTFLPLSLPEHWAADYGLLDLSSWGVGAGFVLGWLVYSFLGFVWHRASHALPFLWRGFHQLHHAPTRLDTASAAIFHPTEVVVYTLITWVVTVLLLGLSPEAAALLGFFAAFVSFFQHANIRTPRWLGYIVQRPEAHSLHHHRNGPVGNYSDFPLWDIVFGSFENPVSFAEQVGFERKRAGRVVAMLGFVDVHAQGGEGGPAQEPAQDGAGWVAPRV
jgi:sterol desaturase/sphingolipid hydroxylase (fatty acid hydroxylase superfamily)